MSMVLSREVDAISAVIGHRGACGYAPENTLASIKRAYEIGIKWVEFDVKLTADGEVILFHDETLDRTTNGSGSVNLFSLDELQRLDAGSWFGREFTGQKVPTLKEVIYLLEELALRTNIEIKPTDGREEETAEAVCRVINCYWPREKPMPLISSFKDTSLAVVRDNLPLCDRALLVLEVPADWQERVKILDCTAIHAWCKHLKKSNIDEIRSEGYLIRSYTVNNIKIANLLWNWGVESVVSDFPDKILASRCT